MHLVRHGKRCWSLHWPGIEPGPPAWQARILPLNHQCLGEGDFHTPFFRGEILKSIWRQQFHKCPVAVSAFETASSCASPLWRHHATRLAGVTTLEMPRIELGASYMLSMRSTTELHPLGCNTTAMNPGKQPIFCGTGQTSSAGYLQKLQFAQRGARTHDPEIKSLMLYRLS